MSILRQFVPLKSRSSKGAPFFDGNSLILNTLKLLPKEGTKCNVGYGVHEWGYRIVI